ncbi:hypothetical protein AMECASPLE_025364 [Ameca splendens]|uniref:Uncharacterized protein n=1 Tax=Ameca splendens TaxID=208324 RepID=A0ABV0ZPJ6_9TELE
MAVPRDAQLLTGLPSHLWIQACLELVSCPPMALTGWGRGSTAGSMEEEKEPQEDIGEEDAENCKQTCTLFSGPLISHKQDSSLVVISHKRLPHCVLLFHSPCLSSAYLPHQNNYIKKYIKCFSDPVCAHLSRKRGTGMSACPVRSLCLVCLGVVWWRGEERSEHAQSRLGGRKEQEAM